MAFTRVFSGTNAPPVAGVLLEVAGWKQMCFGGNTQKASKRTGNLRQSMAAQSKQSSGNWIRQKRKGKPHFQEWQTY